MASFQPTSPSAAFLITASESPAPCPVWASGIYFYGTFLYFTLNQDAYFSHGLHYYKTKLKTFAVGTTLGSDGSYGITDPFCAAVTPFSAHHLVGEAQYATVMPVRTMDAVYVFVPQNDWQTVHIVAITPDAAPGTISAGYYDTLTLPNPAPGFVLRAQTDGRIQLLYPDATAAQIDTMVYDPANKGVVTASAALPVSGPAQAPFQHLSVADVPLGAGAVNLAFTDATNETYLGQVVSGSVTQLEAYAGTTSGASDLKVTSGPVIGQSLAASVVNFVAAVGTGNAVNYMQAPLGDPGNMGLPAVLGSGQPFGGNVNGTFLSEGYVPLPLDGSGQSPGLCRFAYYGVVLDQGSFWLNLIPTGQLFTQPAVITDTSETNGLTPQELAVYQQSWTLLGIVQGPPPWVDNGSANGASLGATTTATIEFTTGAGQTSTVSYGLSVSAGGSASGEIFSFSGSISYELKRTQAKTQKYATDQTFTLVDAPANTGLIVVSQPTVSNTEYKVYSPDGGTSLHFSVYLVQVTGVVTTVLDYDITQPGANAYSAGLNRLPASTELEKWTPTHLPVPTLSQTTLVPPGLTGTAASSGTSQFSESTGQDVTSSNEVDVSATVGVLGFSSTVGFTWSASSEAKTSFGSAYSSAITAITVHNPVQSTDAVQVEIQPYILRTTAAVDTLTGLVPTIYSGSSPWILTWRVLDISYGSASASTPGGKVGKEEGKV